MRANATDQAAELVAWLRAALKPGSLSAEPGLWPAAMEGASYAVHLGSAAAMDAREPSGDRRPLGEDDAFWTAAGTRQARAAKEAVLDICAQGCRYQTACRTTACGLYRVEMSARRSLSGEAGLQ